MKSTELLRLQNHKIIAVSDIRHIEPATDADRARVARLYNIDASCFQTVIRYSDGSQNIVADTIDQIDNQIGLVNLHGDQTPDDRQPRYVPAANIQSAAPFTDEDAARMTAAFDARPEPNRTTAEAFKARVEISGQSQMLSRDTAEAVMTRRIEAARRITRG